MPTLTDFLPGVPMPWILAIPALPILFMLFKRPPFSGLNVAMIVFCICSLLSNLFFNLIARNPGWMDDNTLIFGVIVDFLLSMGLVLCATENRIMKTSVLVASVAYVMVVLVLMIVAKGRIQMGVLLGIGYLLVFTFSLLAILSTSKRHPHVFLTEVPVFWTSAGLMLHFGMIAILLFTQSGSEPSDWMKDRGFAWVYTIANLLRILLFSAAVLSWPSRQSLEDRATEA